MRRVVMAFALAVSLLRLLACGTFPYSTVETDAGGDGGTSDATVTDGFAGATDANVLADASSDAADAGPYCSPSAPFGNFATLPGLTSLSYAATARLTADELSMYFQANPTGSDYDIYLSTRASVAAPWGMPVTLPTVDLMNVTEGSPSPFPDGLSLVFADDRNGMGQGTWLATRGPVDASFTVAAAPLAQVNGVTEGEPFYDPNQRRVYFISNSATRAGLIGGYDVIQGDLVVNALQNVESVPGINSTLDESHPSLSADALSIYFASTRGGSEAVWVAQRSSLADGFGSPVLAADFDGDVIPSWFSPDGCRVYAFRPTDGGDVTEIVMATRPPM